VALAVWPQLRAVHDACDANGSANRGELSRALVAVHSRLVISFTPKVASTSMTKLLTDLEAPFGGLPQHLRLLPAAVREDVLRTFERVVVYVARAPQRRATAPSTTLVCDAG
jgi:hypothetical protein